MDKVCLRCGSIVYGYTCSTCERREAGGGMSRTGIALCIIGVVGVFFSMFLGFASGSSGGYFIFIIGFIISIILMVIGGRKQKLCVKCGMDYKHHKIDLSSKKRLSQKYNGYSEEKIDDHPFMPRPKSTLD